MAATPNLLTPRLCLEHPRTIGAKALHLAELAVTQKLPVPDFLVIPVNICQRIAEKEQDANELMPEITATLHSKRYAVRSSALREDSTHSAMAGQFLTVLDVSPNELATAIVKVVADTKKKSGNANGCSVIIQSMVKSRLSGVLFTRNPKEGREAIVEYISGRGDALVSGQKQPSQIRQIWNLPFPAKPSWLPTLLEYGRGIERHYGHPQDIEWSWDGHHLLILQARPITTLSPEGYQLSLLLDECTPKAFFLYEQTEVTEIAPRPTPFTLSLLKKIYAKHGPIDQTYGSLGINYSAKDLLRILGNQLYVDREIERENFFPSGSLPKRIAGAQNKKALQRMLPPDPQTLSSELARAFAHPVDVSSPKVAIDSFLTAYQLIFRINLFAQAALNRLESAGRPLKKGLNELLEIPEESELPDLNEIVLTNLRGNALEVADRSMFRKAIARKREARPAWFTSLPGWKQQYIQPTVDKAQNYLTLREQGRWYTVWLINQLRTQLKPFDPFRTVDEYARGKRIATAQRQKEWRAHNAITFPARVSNQFNEDAAVQAGISAGKVSGLVVTIDNLPKNDKAILATALLTPDIVELFPRISGIIASTGGLLSHLAIMAREAGIPVVSGVPNIEEYVGLTVRVDGKSGTITAIKQRK